MVLVPIVTLREENFRLCGWADLGEIGTHIHSGEAFYPEGVCRIPKAWLTESPTGTQVIRFKISEGPLDSPLQRKKQFLLDLVSSAKDKRFIELGETDTSFHGHYTNKEADDRVPSFRYSVGNFSVFILQDTTIVDVLKTDDDVLVALVRSLDSISCHYTRQTSVTSQSQTENASLTKGRCTKAVSCYEDIPEMAIKRQHILTELIDKSAELFRETGVHNRKRTKFHETARKVGNRDFFQGHLFRMLYTQKMREVIAIHHREGIGTKLYETLLASSEHESKQQAIAFDPLFPAFLDRDIHFLKELLLWGMTSKEAIMVAEECNKLCTSAAVTLGESRADVSGSQPETGRIAMDFDVRKRQYTLSFMHTSVAINEEHFKKLERMHRGPKDVFQTNVFLLLCRYEALAGSTSGYQAALPERVFTRLKDLLGVSHECFASPLNCFFEKSFCSAFLDTDKAFGSSGSFFEFFPLEGSFEINPPFGEAIMAGSAFHMENLLRLAEKQSKSLTFVAVIPAWKDSAAYDAYSSSSFLRAELCIPGSRHTYKVGLQHRERQQYWTARRDTLVFVCQTSAAFKEVPIDERMKRDLLDCFCAPPERRVDRERERYSGKNERIAGASYKRKREPYNYDRQRTYPYRESSQEKHRMQPEGRQHFVENKRRGEDRTYHKHT